MALRFVLFWLNKAPPTAPCTTPTSIIRAKCVTALQTYGAVVGFFLLALRLFSRASLPSLLTAGAVLFGTLCLQGITMFTWTQLDAWKEPVCRERNRIYFPARIITSLLTASLAVATLRTEEPTIVVGGLLGAMWWSLWEQHECVMRGVLHGSDVPHQHAWAAFCFHCQMIIIWIKRVWKECAVFYGVLLGLKAAGVVPLPPWSAWTGVSVMLVMLTAVWMTGVNLFYETVNSRFNYGDYADPKTFVKVMPSIRSDSQIAKRYGLGYLKWVVSAGNGIGQEYRKTLFDGETTQAVWDGCASACCSEINALSECIIHAIGKVPDITSPMLCAKRGAVYGIGMKIQHKYAMLSRCLGCLSGMLCAAPEEDVCGTAKYGHPSIGKIMTSIFEAHFLLRYFVTTGAPFLHARLPFGEIWAPKSVLLEFERTHVAIWKHYGGNIFVQMDRAPRFLPAAVLINEIKQFTGARD